MRVIVNGKEMDITEDITILELLDKLNIKDKTMAAAINMQVIKKDDWQNVKLREDDKVEFLHFVGGG